MKCIKMKQGLRIVRVTDAKAKAEVKGHRAQYVRKHFWKEAGRP